MLSDVLFEAVEQIEHSQHECPDIYDGYKDRLGVIKSLMDSIRIELDSPLGLDEDRTPIMLATLRKRVADTITEEPLRSELLYVLGRFR